MFEEETQICALVYTHSDGLLHIFVRGWENTDLPPMAEALGGVLVKLASEPAFVDEMRALVARKS